uniref:Coat protein n=1 Tax=Tobacco mosaic virus (strain vulgare) TaxID=12243 RepID=UPI0001C4A178|nr:Chain A, Coat protein [Tobacco mosaic virus (vulgare)]3KML_B Chain B, Coat protein [Tobacco mosaic virus (vulgare)]3KML_C Chain C, Coat protein [Tobacco mosaic virus (vulgare)]3KML_D Chain D, Coat protein [Tobacco mosaic virus (vulgare)]3KML_E Chain E, Coat protein [Tobacco mosaic virus (vulgare)]3KML_F Chain F, Coat protein [Tobacco mosaic virus (vulgare)]3KML_G Chain G, Coat protein [Tobacco mosaic virus (vulgare)]3KML_H Chain H, Coat protein [Tobacco mosaic virus (vulgare)]3KML_I Chai
GANPTTAETLDATRRVDDATVAIRCAINNLIVELIRGTGSYNRSSFESSSGLVWTSGPAGEGSYSITTPSQFVFLSSAWADPIELINLCTNALGNQFQTQQARTVVQRQFSEVWKPSPQVTVRFPDSDFKVYRYNAVLDPLVTALLGAFDTRNRIIEVENQ